MIEADVVAIGVIEEADAEVVGVIEEADVVESINVVAVDTETLCGR